RQAWPQVAGVGGAAAWALPACVPSSLPISSPSASPCCHFALAAPSKPRALLLPSVPCSPRLASAEAPDAMEEWDVPQMKKEVESLKYQLAFKRELSSQTIPELLKWIEDGIPKDPFLNPELMKNNPWVERGKCAIL
uniref:G protein subunit gamma 13 n=1 Tax=Equus caballus TaxID=9796 RepID=F6Q3Q7_HORSE